MKADILAKARQAISRAGFKVQKHSPEILVAAGIAGTIVSAVMACRATLKVDGIFEKTADKLELIEEQAAKPENADAYTEEDAENDRRTLYLKTAAELAKLYAPAITLGAFSLGCIVASNGILKKRNAALAAAYATVNRTFKDYRARVTEKLGKEADRAFRHGLKAEQFEKTVTGEDGQEKTVTGEVETATLNEHSDYARFFDEASPYWDKNPEYNLIFLRAQQNYANDRLRAEGRLFLNEVYEALGIPKTKAGQVVGWVYDEKNPVGDNYVDFGIYEVADERKRAFVNGYERNILLDFNVDGNIWELM